MRKSAENYFKRQYKYTKKLRLKRKLPKLKDLIPSHSWKIVKNDLVEVVQGYNKGIKGNVIKVQRRRNRIWVQGAQFAKKKKKQQQGKPALEYKIEQPIHISNVQLVDPSTGKGCKVIQKRKPDGPGKLRVSAETGAIIPKPGGKKKTTGKQYKTNIEFDTPLNIAKRYTYEDPKFEELCSPNLRLVLGNLYRKRIDDEKKISKLQHLVQRRTKQSIFNPRRIRLKKIKAQSLRVPRIQRRARPQHS